MVIDLGWFKTAIGISTDMLFVVTLLGFKNSSPVSFGGIYFNYELVSWFRDG